MSHSAWKPAKAIRDQLEGGPHGIEMVEPLKQAEVGEIVGDQFVAQKGQELLILFEEAALEVGAEDMMAVLDLVDDRGQLAMHPATDPLADRDDSPIHLRRVPFTPLPAKGRALLESRVKAVKAVIILS